VRFGWLKPILRIRIPDEFFLAWKNYPVFQFENPEDFAEFEWVLRLYGISNPQFRYGGWGESKPPKDWYVHPLDDRRHPGIEEILRHQIDASAGQKEPPALTHPSGCTILPWIDLFAYWQAYHVAELLQALPLSKPILNLPDAVDRIKWMADQHELLKKLSDAWISAIDSRWTKRAPVFEWLGRYRTALGYWVGSGLDADCIEAAGKQIATVAQLDRDRIQVEIRDCLLVLWEDFEWRYKDNPIPASVRELLRQDVLRAVEFLVAVSGVALDPDDPFWEPRDRQPREWARLSEVLPFENQVARRSFWERAPFYLERLNEVLPEPDRLTKARIESITKASWLTSPAFQRFCLAFERLHQQFGEGTSSRRRLDLRTSTPVDYLLLCALFTEKLLLERYLKGRPPGTQAPDFNPLVRDVANRLARHFSIPDLSARIPWKLAILHDLPAQKHNPFSTGRNLPRTSLAEALSAMFFDFLVTRNYAAHHDCIDDEIVYRAWGRDPLEALLGVTLLTLS
jgi:hypothetical protein